MAKKMYYFAAKTFLLNFNFVITSNFFTIACHEICLLQFLSILGWLVLNVSKAVRQWQKDYRTNQGLMVEVTEASSSHQVHPVALGLITTRQASGDKEV